MKNLIIKLASVCLLAGLFSCKNSLDVMKRHYTDGFYVNHSGKTRSSDEKQIAKKNKTTGTHKETTVFAENKNEKVSSNLKPETTVNQVSDNQTVTQTTGKISAQNPCEKEKKNNSSYKKDNKEEEKTTVVNNSNKTGKSEQKLKGADAPVGGAVDSDAMFIIELILSFFVPPLAVYLKQNGVTKWFWVTLILCLLTWSGFYLTAFYGLWAVAFVIALLVVLDILS